MAKSRSEYKSPSEYNRKRNFDITSEPREGPSREALQRSRREPGHALRFVIQKHDARRLHYDFRLEMQGTLKSWAIPKGPSLDPKEKRLAVHVEDHPLAYADFEGAIPAGQYGGGDVIVWDHGIWQPHGDPVAAYAAGKLKFSLVGEKLAGDWTLVRTRLRGSGDKEQWLLIKEQDNCARASAEYDIVAAQPASVLTGAEIPAKANTAMTAVQKKAAPKETTIKKAKTTATDKTTATEKTTVMGKKAAAGKTTTTGAAAAGKVAIRSTAKTSKKNAPTPAKQSVKLPALLTPELATLRNEPPAGEWFYEIKYDGYRILSRIENGKVQLYTRKGNDWTARMPLIVQALESLQLEGAWLDGEVVVLDERGLPNFQALQQAFEIGRGKSIIYYLFDAPFFAGEDLRQVPVEERRARLQQVLPAAKSGPLRFSEAFTGDHRDIVASACAMSLEGLIGKRLGSPYTSRRSGDWIKLKCRPRQEFVIVGYTEPKGSRAGFGALLLGVYAGEGPDRQLHYAGRVGTGFNDLNLRQIQQQLQALERPDPPLDQPLRGVQARGVHWVEPQLVGEVEFAEWTQEGILRQAAFIALRTDKPATEIVRETAVSSTAGAGSKKAGASEGSPATSNKAAGKTGRTTAKTAKTTKEAEATGSIKTAKVKSGKKAEAGTVAGVKITHPARIIDSKSGTSKIALAEFYAAIGKWLLPHLERRPVSLLRAPDGVEGEKFFQKHAERLAIPHMRHLPLELDPGHARLMEINSLPALIGSAQMGTIELHTWGATVDAIENPDRFILDLDPDPALPWRSVVEAARLTLAVLDELELQAYLKTTGGKGLHLVVPLGQKNDWVAVKAFSKAIAEFMAKQIPERFVAKMGPKNRIGKIFVDYLRNQRGASTVSAYSVRAQPGLPVSVPISRDELTEVKSSTQWHIGNVLEHLVGLKSHPWKGYKNQQTITAAMWKKLDAKQVGS